MLRRKIILSTALMTGLAVSAVDVSTDTVLTENTDWRGQGVVTVAGGVTLDLGGHKLYADGLGGSGTVLGSAAATYRFYRFKIDDTRGTFSQISELKLFNGEEDVTRPYKQLYYDNVTTTSDGKVFGNGEVPENAVDGNPDVNTKWLDFRANPSESPEVRSAAWLTLEYEEPLRVTSYEWWTGDTSWCSDRNPKSWRLQGSDDNLTWVDLDVQTERTDVSSDDWTMAYKGSPASPDATSELHLDVQDGATVTVTDTLIAGRLRLVKEGDGELVMAKTDQTFADGTLVSAGTAALGTDGANVYGAAPQPVTVGPDGAFDVRGIAGLGNLQLVLAGGELRSSVAMALDGKGAAPAALTDDSSAVLTADFVWGGNTTDLGGKTLTAMVADGARLVLKTQAMRNGSVTVGSAESAGGVLQVSEACDLKTVDLDCSCVLDIQSELNLRDFTVRDVATLTESANGRVKVFGAYCPEGAALPAVELQDGSTLDLSGQSGIWALGDCTFANGAAVAISVDGRSLEKGDQVVSWERFPSNYATLKLSFKAATGESVEPLVATSSGIFYGSQGGSVIVASARWTGEAGDGDVTNYKNWACFNAGGETIPSAIPGADASVTIGGDNLKINLSSDSVFVCGTLVLADCTLSGDSDLSGATVDSGNAKINLNGHSLVLGSLNGIDEVTDATGEGVLRVSVPTGVELVNAGVALTGALKLVKEGEGAFVAACIGQTYTGGTEVVGGVLRQGIAEIDRPFGAAPARVVVKNGGVFDACDRQTGALCELVADGGTLLLASTGSPEVPQFADFVVVNDAERIADNEIQLTKASSGQRGAAYWSKRVNPAAAWRASFTYKTVEPKDPADGFTFILHNDPDGIAAIGEDGGKLAANTIAPSYGCAYTIYGGDSAGWLVDGAKTDMTYVGDTFIDQGVDVVVEYDGMGKLRQTITSVDGVKSYEREVDLAAKLGTSAWIGFTGACGGSSCDQRIVDFVFEPVHAIAPDMSPNEDNWKFNKDAEVLEREEIGKGFQLTPNESMKHGSVTLRDRINLRDAFRISGTYRVFADGDSPADGAAFVFHNDKIAGCGDNGGSRGFIGGDNGLPTCVGWAFNIYGDQKLEEVSAASVVGTHYLADSGISFKGGVPVDFVLTYQDGQLTMDLVQTVEEVEYRYSATQTVDLAARFGVSTAYFSMTGGTGGLFGLQCVYNLSYESLVSQSVGYGALQAASSSTIQIRQTVADATTLDALLPASGATLSFGAAEPVDLDYEVAVETLKVPEGGSATMVFAPNGVGIGTIRLGAIEATAKGGIVKIVGNVAPLNGKIQVRIPPFKGYLPLLDLSEATGDLTTDDFELVTDTKDPKKIRLSSGGILSVSHVTGLMVQIL